MSPLHVVILAAGQGSRMKSSLPKVLHPVAGKAMLHHVVDTAKQLGAEKIHTVIGHGADQVRASLEDDSVNWVLQTEQLGTGHAVAQALPALPITLVFLCLTILASSSRAGPKYFLGSNSAGFSAKILRGLAAGSWIDPGKGRYAWLSV